MSDIDLKKLRWKAEILSGMKKDEIGGPVLALLDRLESAERRAEEAENEQARPVVLTRMLGMRGAAFDGPGAHRAYTYQEQPGNIAASRLGGAACAAMAMRAGDSIDRGLGLLKALEDVGYGVFQIDLSDSAMAQEGGK